MKKEQFKEGTIIKGRDLKGYTLCKVLQEDMKMQDFQYQIGENVDVNPLELEGTCKKGLYFIETKNAVDFMEYGSKIAIVEIPEEENVYVDKGKFRTHRLIIKNIMLLNEIDTWKYLFQNGAIIGKNGGRAFERVMEYGDLDLVKYLIENGADITAGTESVLHIIKNDKIISEKKVTTSNLVITYAAMNGHLDIVKYLHENGADIEKDDNNSALGMAARSGHLDVVKYLHENGADVNKGFALEVAAAHNHMDVVKYLCENGANANEHCSGLALRPLVKYGRLDILKYLHENGLDIMMGDGVALGWAVCADRLDVVEYLYEHRREGVPSKEKIEDCIEGAKMRGYLDIAEYLQKQSMQN